MKTSTLIVLNNDGTLNEEASTKLFLAAAELEVGKRAPLAAEAAELVANVYAQKEAGAVLSSSWVLTQALADVDQARHGKLTAAVKAELNNKTKFETVKGAQGGKRQL